MTKSRPIKSLRRSKSVMGRSLEQYSYENPAPIVILGLSGSGKTALFRRLQGKSLEHRALRTYGVDSEIWQYDSFFAYLFDLGGVEAIRKMIWPSYAQIAKGIIFMIDGADSKRLKEAYESLIDILAWVDPDIPILICQNKCDLPEFAVQGELVNKHDLRTAIAKQNNPIRVFETSVLEECNIFPALEWLIEGIHQIAISKPVQLQAARVYSLKPLTVLAEVGRSQVFEHTLEIFTHLFYPSLINLKYMPLAGGNYLVSCSSEHYYCLAIFHEETTPAIGLAFAEFFLEIVEQKILESGQPFPQLNDVGNQVLVNLQAIPYLAP